MGRLYKVSEVARMLNVHRVTVLRWICDKKIRAIRIGKLWMIPEEEVRRLLGGKQEDVAVLYARISREDQKGDLEKQLKTLEQYATARGYKIAEMITDIASGLNENRNGLKKLIELAKEGKFNILVITYPDRLTRFGFKYLEELFTAYGVRIETVFMTEKSPKEELLEDLLFIVTSFAGKLYGIRSHKKRKLVQGFKQLLKEIEGE
ncbi:MAG: IS607 family transposase [Thermoplasmata archaeon]|nr:MAG: IS607 family transposase [Thermoplasmata archaeon]